MPPHESKHSEETKEKMRKLFNWQRWRDGDIGPMVDPEAGLSHLDRAPARTFAECWRRARDPKRRIFIQP